MNKKNILIILCTVFTSVLMAQKHNIVNASIALKNENYSDAKKYIDEAYSNESTSNSAKMWNYRAPIYLQIAIKDSELDNDAILKATEAHIKCLQEDKKGRVIVRKWTNKEDIISGVVNCAYKLFNLAIEEFNAANYERAIQLYTAIFDIIPFDEENQLKRGNISKETILFNSFFASKKMNDNVKSKDLLQQLIDMNFNEPSIFIHMSNIFIEEGNTDQAINYLNLGRDMFEDDQSLINTEINLYIQLGRTTELIAKLSEAIELDPENDLLYFNRATMYDQKGDFVNAENDYLISLELNKSSFGANYNLGALYFNAGVETNNKANNTSNNTTYKKLKSQADNSFSKALPFLEMAFDLDNKDKNTLLSLKQLYYLNGDYKKSELMKQYLADL